MSPKKMRVLADEVEVGDLVQHPDWVGTDRTGAVEEIEASLTGRWITFAVAGTAKPMKVYAEDYVSLVKP